MDAASIADVVHAFRPEVDVLELACGEGAFTRELVRFARSVTAVDSSPAMLERNRTQTASGSVRYVEADLFDWRPDRAYDTVFFANWLSHVPPSMFDRFWGLVEECVRPGGRVGFLDEDDRAEGHDECHVVDGVPVATRTLADGRRFDVVKVFWHPDDLATRLVGLGWAIELRRVGASFLFGVAERA
jgi:demethylmenaquinone methyltransferase/2-methoxy-6-polyprenyl-1,4-benzoquinol methylase